MRDDALRILIDARPLATDHRQRGIGAYVFGPLSQIEKMRSADELDGIEVAYLWPASESRLLGRAPWPGSDAPLEPRLVSSLEEGEWDVYHATTVEGVTLSSRFRTVATLYDLIPLRQADWRSARDIPAPIWGTCGNSDCWRGRATLSACHTRQSATHAICFTFQLSA